MRQEREIKERVRGLLVNELNRRVRESTLRLPYKCTYNVVHPLDVRKTVGGEPNPNYNHIRPRLGNQALGLCFYGAENLEEWPGNVCDEPIDAKRCPYFTPMVSKEDILAKFREDLGDASWLQENLPEVAGLLWVLELADPPRLPWWKKWWFRFLRIRVEPISSVYDLQSLIREDDPEVAEMDELCDTPIPESIH